MTSRRDIPKVKVFKEGDLVREGATVLDSSSTVTLVEVSGQRLVVNTGSPRDAPGISASFRRMGVPLDSIKFVVNTHLHVDHIGCNEIFPNARIVALALEHPPVGSSRVTEKVKLLRGVEVVPTPGHTYGSISVFASGVKRYAICGDAIPTPENYQRHVPPSINCNPVLATESMDLILAWAEVVVPGHGAPFEVPGKK